MKEKEANGQTVADLKIAHLPDLDLTYQKSKEDIWADLSQTIDFLNTNPSNKTLLVTKKWILLAASVVLLAGITTFMKLYSKEIITDNGQHLTANLPDGSEVTLNAGTKIKYHPLWWSFNREVELSGEAFFTVKKGKQFDVLSSNAKTSVLGTSFNIYARHEYYQVTCYSGKVKVTSFTSGNKLYITPNEKASLNKDGSLQLSKLKDIKGPVAWMNNMFIFTGTPINAVFEEIERQYAVKITTNTKYKYLYTGNFTRNQPVEQVLKMICRPYGLKFRKTGDVYLIVKK
ncbi:FecR family protein [Geofilum sp. OHC36d9]|uniref:FecR family protein n=1 Tax=Geofilum sp. OHC36d9 TaxID=3458413 RepID=UPI004033941E